MSRLVIAADTHKSTPSFSAGDDATARVAAERALDADRAGMLQMSPPPNLIDSNATVPTAAWALT